jgi:serpin B
MITGTYVRLVDDLLYVVLVALAVGILFGGSAATAAGDSRLPHKRAAEPPPPALGPAAATAAFGLDLLRAQPSGNLVLSPDSVAAALAMTGTGAAGGTAAQIARTLHLRGPARFAAVGRLQRTIAKEQSAAAGGDPKAPTLGIANGLFLQQGFPTRPTFVSGLQQHFGVVPSFVDFSGDPAGALNTINEWVSDNTGGLIPELLASLPENMVLALANAVYLKAGWLHPFKPGRTSPGPFFAAGGRTTAKFMRQTQSLRYGSGKDYKAVALPYRSSTLSLLVVLPVGQRLGSLQHRLGARALAAIARGLSRRPVMLRLPRFHLNTEADLTGTLKRLGMPAAFGVAADFSRITTAVPLKIDVVKHAADFAVDEAGTVAAAATVVGAVPVSGRPVQRDAVAFNANRPFLFFLRDDRTGAVLFAGRLTKPRL